MLGESLGPYRIESELGSGGMGMVYLATVAGETPAVPQGKQVALKVIHNHLLEKPGFFKRFLREAEIGRAVRHENVVRTFDVDAILHGGKSYHYLVMEYVEGRDLRSLLRDLGTVPETLLREIAAQVASGLTAVHEAGVVHRDLKPENVLITDDHQVQIMDLGVAQLTEVSIAITRQGEFAGSLLYASPEQFRRDNVGPRADLYSLGVVLHELATAENPFMGDTPSAVIASHLNAEPPRVSDRNSEVTLFFSEIVSTLLAKSPDDRFGSAQELHDVLRASESSEWWAEREPALLVSRTIQPKIRVRRETEMHGRDAEVSILQEAWEEAKRGEGNTVFVEGEPGIGKTRLVDAFLRSIETEEPHVLYGSYPPSGGMGGISDALVDHFGAAGLVEALRPYLTVTSALIPAFAALIRHESAPTGAEQLSADAVSTVFVHLVRALAAEKPVVWVVDDLHYAPADSRQILHAMARAVDGHRVLLLGTTRPDTEGGLAEFSKMPNFRRVPVGRLSPRQVIELLREAFHSELLAQRLGGKIAFKSDGVPFFVFEMIRGLKEGQFLQQLADGTYVETQVIEDIEVPSAVRDLIEGRLQGLSDEDRNLLDVAAIQGHEFDAGVVAAVCELKRVLVLQKLAAMERRSGLIRSGGSGYRFDHHQIQEVLYSQVPPELAAEYHSMICEARAERPDVAGKEPAEVAGNTSVFLADHGLRGSRPELGLPYLDGALKHLAGTYSREAAIALCDRALASEGLIDDERRFELLLARGAHLYALGRVQDALSDAEQATALAERLGSAVLQSKGKSQVAWLLTSLARYAEAATASRDALAHALDAADPMAEHTAQSVIARVAALEGRREAAVEARERALQLVRDIGDQAQEIASIVALGSVLRDPVRRRELFERAKAMMIEEGNRTVEASVHTTLATLADDEGRFADAVASSERALVIHRELGARRGEAIVLHNLGAVLMRLGRLDQARAFLETALALGQELEYRHFVAATMLVLADAAEVEGATDEQRSWIEQARALLDELGVKDVYAAGADDSLAEVEASAGRSGEARRLLESALETGRRLGESGVVALALSRLALLDRAHVAEAERALADINNHSTNMRAHFRLFQATADAAHLTEAHRLLEHLVAHAPEDCRTSMIENVPLHRDITAAWQEHGA